MTENSHFSEDPYAPSFLPEDEHLDSFPEDVFTPEQSGIMSHWEKEYQKRLEAQTPDDELLTAEQEKELSVEIQEGLKAAKDLITLRRITPEQRSELEKQVEKGRASRDTLVTSNLRLAAWFVRGTMNFQKKDAEKDRGRVIQGAIYRNLGNLSGGELDYSDRMQIASIGLIKAAENFTAIARFSTFSMYSMEGELGRALFKIDTPLTIPVNKVEELHRFEKEKRALTEQFDREPTLDELSRELIWSLGRVRELESLSRRGQRLSYEQLAEIYNSENNTTDYAGENDATDEITLSDVLPDHGIDLNTEDEVALNDLGSKLDQALSKLDGREQQIIEMRYGLVDGTTMTLEEIGNEFGVSRERVRQIESKMYSKLRSPENIKRLSEYLGIDQDPNSGVSAALHTSEATKIRLGVNDSSVNIGNPTQKPDKPEEDSELRFFPRRSFTPEQLERMQADFPDEDESDEDFYGSDYR